MADSCSALRSAPAAPTEMVNTGQQPEGGHAEASCNELTLACLPGCRVTLKHPYHIPEVASHSIFDTLSLPFNIPDSTKMFSQGGIALQRDSQSFTL